MIFYYYVLVAIIGAVWGIVIAARAKRANGVVYGALDKVGIATNIIMIPVYFIFTCFFSAFIFLMFRPREGGIIEILAWIVSYVGASGPLFCGLGLGKAVALRRAGKRTLGFLVQFAGVVGLGITLLFAAAFYESLFMPIN